MSKLETAEETVSAVPVLFPENESTQEAFAEIAAALMANPALYRKTVPDNLRTSLGWIIEHLNFDSIFRGDDFYPDFPESKDLAWLISEEHSYLYDLGLHPRRSKLGRLGGVIAMHPRRDEIASLITPEMVKKWFQEAPPAFLPHISRLLTHANTPACEDFAIEFLRHPEFWDKTPGNSDGNDCFTFWTYAPYVITQLQNGNPPGESLIKVMTNWCMKRKRTRSGNAKYPGIEHMYDGIERYHYLRPDGRDASHAFVNFIAQKAIIPSITS